MTVHRKYRLCFCYLRALIPRPASLCSPNNAACTRSKLINESASLIFPCPCRAVLPALVVAHGSDGRRRRKGLAGTGVWLVFD